MIVSPEGSLIMKKMVVKTIVAMHPTLWYDYHSVTLNREGIGAHDIADSQATRAAIKYSDLM